MAKPAKTTKAMTVSKPSGPEFVECEQGSDEWFLARLGLPTASHFSTIMASGVDGGDSITRRKLMNRLAGEIITGEPAEETFKSVAMDRGNRLEPQARDSFAKRRNVTLRRVGFVKNFTDLKRCGASPDSLIGFGSGLEVKTARADILIPMLKNPAKMPPEHRAQIHGNMWVTERDEWWLTVYCHRNLPALDLCYRRDEAFIKEISNAVERFNYELQQLVTSLRKMGASG